eukprot:TRINITY_DN2765_c0_g2_i4.p1 TRINITY_DN2765_c0_g2~~TRINITY_DN2765_c0_g2_i4.p1  ORF type:complete len:869 (+),score=129.33 TRINITY_DN2765_c0_g2_i4:69-2675(+)
MEWQPRREGVEQILQTLCNIENPDQKVQRTINDNLTQFKQDPEYNRYLAFILTLVDQHPNIRSCAGLILKNNIKPEMDTSEQVYVKNQIVKVIGDPNSAVRRVGGSLITTIIGVGSIGGWDGILHFLVNCLKNSDRNVVDGAFYALSLICEDHHYELDSEHCGRPLNFLLPIFLEFFKNDQPELRYYAISCILRCIHFLPHPFVLHLDIFMQGFFYLSRDSEAKIRSSVVNAFVILVKEEETVNLVKNYLPRMMEVILRCMKEDNPDLIFPATEFWKCISEHEQICVDYVTSVLPELLSVLLVRMMYSEQEVLSLSGGNDSHLPDEPQNIKPVMWGPKDEGDNLNDVSNWTIRKSSAETLDFLSRPFYVGFSEVLLPLIELGLKSSNWLHKESAILALGCIAHGQQHVVTAHLPVLVAYLFDSTNDSHPLIRSISCWTLSRYSRWISMQEDKENYFYKLVASLLARMSDPNKEAQKVACASLAQICENSTQSLEPYAEAILTEFSKAFTFFKKNSLYVLYDAIGAIAQAMGQNLNQPKYLQLIFPPLLRIWDHISNDDTDLFPLLDCFRYIAVALKSSFIPYVQPIFSRCLHLIRVTLEEHPKSAPNDPDRQFLICSLDMLSGLCEGVSSHIGLFVRNSDLVSLLVVVLKDPSPDYSQSSYALVGDLARHCVDTLVPVLSTIIPILIQGAHDLDMIEKSNNALWALGEIVVAVSSSKPCQLPPEILAPYLGQILKLAFSFLDDPEFPELMETCSVVIGRVTWVLPEQTLPCLPSILKTLCVSLRGLADAREKEDALKGLCTVTLLQPELVLKDFATFCDLLTSWQGSDPDLKNTIHNLLLKFKLSLANWEKITSNFSPHLKEKMKDYL